LSAFESLVPSLAASTAFIALDSVSVLVGRDDTGKSRPLRYIARTLGEAAAGECSHEPSAMPTFYLDLGESPLRWLDEALDAVSGSREDLILRTRHCSDGRFSLRIPASPPCCSSKGHQREI